VTSEPDWRVALALHRDHGWTYTQIGELFGRSYQTVSLHLRALGAKRRRSPAWHTPEGRSLRRLWTSMRMLSGSGLSGPPADRLTWSTCDR